MRKERLFLLFVSDCFVTQQQLKNVRDDSDDSYDWYGNRLINCYKEYQKRRSQKAKIKEEL